VLTGAPPSEPEPGDIISSGPPGSSTQTSARAQGEDQRQSRQRSEFQLEMAADLEGAAKQSDRNATTALIAALTPLRWSNPAINAISHAMLAILQEELNSPAPAVCADMHSWVASGYKTLSPASKEFEKRIEATIVHFFEVLAIDLKLHVKPLPQSLAPYEDAADKALALRTESLEALLSKDHRAHTDALTQLEAAVGIPARKPLPRRPHRIRKPVVIDRGITAAGGRFFVRAERARSFKPITRRLRRAVRRAACTTEVTIEEPSRPDSGGLLSLFSGGGTDRCLSRYHVTPEQKVTCNAGLLTVEANLLPAARSVRLLLSDKRTITSRAIRVPARLGGPAGLYYQVVRGPSPIPVSLTELDANGNHLTVLKLPAVVECAKKLRKVFPHGIVRLVHETPPEGPAFTIRAERYRELGHIHFELKLEEGGEEESFFSGGGGVGRIEERLEEGPPRGRAREFESKVSGGCSPQPHAIVYGLLRAPRDTVLARVSGSLVPLRKVAIPARLHAGGVLAYGVLSPLPTELLVRDPSGKTVAHENLSEAAQADTEKCEGEAEG
jgi:hypothetical protein